MQLMRAEVVNLSAQGQIAELQYASTGVIKCKFVFMSNPEALYFVFGNISEFPYHANLAEKFCGDRGVACSWERKPDRLRITDDETRVRGGGWIEMDGARKQVRLYGRSSVYGRFRRSDLDFVTETHPFFTTLTRINTSD